MAATMNDDNGQGMPPFRPSPLNVDDLPEEEWEFPSLVHGEDTGHMAGTTPPSVSNNSGNSFVESPDNVSANQGVASSARVEGNARNMPPLDARAMAGGVADGNSMGRGFGVSALMGPAPSGAMRVSGLHFLAPNHMPSAGSMSTFGHSWHPYPYPYAAAGPLPYSTGTSSAFGAPGNASNAGDGGVPSFLLPPLRSADGASRTSPASSVGSNTAVPDLPSPINSSARTHAASADISSAAVGRPTGERDDSSSPSSGNNSNASSDAQSDSWSQKLELLKQYKSRNGNTDVPQSEKPLGTWVNKQRMEKKKLDKGEKTSMTPARKDRLEAIGFKWAKPKGQASWDMRFGELKAFKKKHGHCNVPTKPKDAKYKALGRWVTSQRNDKKKGNITKANEKKLEKIGFTWNRYE